MLIPNAIASRERVRIWIASSGQSKAAIAALADVDEKIVRQAAGRDWNPTIKTLSKLEKVIPTDWQSPDRVEQRRQPKRRAA